MQNDIIAKIDALAKMSESTSNAATLKVELRELDVEIKEKKMDLKELKSSITDDKYFDASGEIVDKNIEISLTKKIRFLNKSLVDVNSKIDDAKNEEEQKYRVVEDNRKIIEESKNFVEVLQTKISSENTEEKETFEKLLKETLEKQKEAEKELKKCEKTYEKIQGKLEVLSLSKTELESKLEEETEKLIDVKANLLNRRGYVNSELKAEDEEKIANLEGKIKELEDKKANILNDPVMIAEEAKNDLIDDDKTGALKKIKELRDIILEQPYMDVDGKKSEETLKIELENAEAKRDEFASMINSKNYESVDTTLLKDRIDYITAKKEELNEEIATIKEQIKKSDLKDLEDLNNRINYCEVEIKTLIEKIAEYELTLASDELVPSKRAALTAAFDKKQEEFANVNEILKLYKEDRQNLITKSYELENETIKAIEDEIKKIDDEKKKLQKMCASSNKAKDIIAMENDKKTLKELNDVVKAIKKRMSLKNTPNELYDEIEVLIGTDEIEDFNDKDIDIEDTIDIPTIEEPTDTKEVEELNFDDDDIEEVEDFDFNEEKDNGIDTNVVEDINDFVIADDNETKYEEPEKEDEINLDDIEISSIEPLDDLVTEEENTEEEKETKEQEEDKEFVKLEEAEQNDEDITQPDFDLDDIDIPENLDFGEIEDTDEKDSVEEIDDFVASLPTIDADDLENTITPINSDDERIKVINIEPLENTPEEDNKEEEQSNTEFLIGDYKSGE